MSEPTKKLEVTIGTYLMANGKEARVTVRNEISDGWNGYHSEYYKGKPADFWSYWNNDGTTYNPHYHLVKRLTEDAGHDLPRYRMKVRCGNCKFRGYQLLCYGKSVGRCLCSVCGCEDLRRISWFWEL